MVGSDLFSRPLAGLLSRSNNGGNQSYDEILVGNDEDHCEEIIVDEDESYFEAVMEDDKERNSFYPTSKR
jgi:hypothetical protein